MESQEHLIVELAWLRRVVVALVGDEASAGDLTQEVALEALLRPPVAEGIRLEGARLRGWLWTIARRKAGRGRERAAARARSEAEAAQPEATSSVLRSAQALEAHRDLVTEIAALDPEDGALIHQRYLDQIPPREIARAMDLPVPTVRKRISRAMERLRERLVHSDRGAEGWSFGLCLIAGSRALPVPAGTEPSASGGTETSTLLERSVAWQWGGAALMLGSLGAAVVLWTPDPGAPAWIEPDRAANQDIDEPSLGELAALPAAEGLPKKFRAAAPAEAPALSGEAVATADLSGSTLRFLDESGAPLPSARAVWADEGWTAHSLDVDADGVSSLPAGARGFVYAGADGFEKLSTRLDGADSTDQEITLRRQRQVAGRLLIDGQAPGREITLWRGRYETNDWPHEINSNEAMKEALADRGLAWTRGSLKVGPDGRFLYVTDATWTDYFLQLPWDLQLLSARGFFNARPGGVSLQFKSDTPELLLKTSARDCVTGRLVWEDDMRPVSGPVEMACLDEQGESLAYIAAFADEEGRFAVPLSPKTNGGDRDGEVWEFLSVSPPGAADGVQVKRRLPRPGEAHDLGTVVIPRARMRYLQIVGLPAEGSRAKEPLPLVAAVASESTEVLSSAGGRAQLRAAAGSTIRILAEGYRYREVAVTAEAAVEETPLVVELEPAPRLRVRFDLGSRVGFEADDSVELVLRMRTSAFEAASASEEASDHFWRTYRRLGGGRVKFFRSEGLEWGLGAGEAIFQGLPDRDLWVDGLRPGARFDVELQDRLGQVLVSESVTMPLTAATPVLDVNFGDLYHSGAAASVELAAFTSSGEPYFGPLYLMRVGLGRVEPEFTDRSGQLALGPLAPGQYLFAEGSRGTPRKGEGVPATLVPGDNVIRLVSVDVPALRAEK